jgi:probable F420-dependent oxidoreductase
LELETLLPLGKVDPGLRAPDIPLDLAKIGADAQLLEEAGYSGLVVEETKEDPFVIMALAAAATSKLRLATGVTIAFPRSPTIMALSAWTIQKLSKGRFTLGLGTQVKAHIERRYGMKASPLAPWMRDYVHAVRAVWECWQNGTPLRFESEHYKLSLMVPLFNPGPIEHPHIPIHLAAVNPIMSALAGEVAEGLRPHPVCTPSYIEKVMLPAVRKGAARTGRSLDDFRICMKPLVATAATDEELKQKVRDTRARIAFYASTPGYIACFEHLGLGDLAKEAQALSKQQRWEELSPLISDEILDQFAVIGTHDQIGRRLVARFGGLATNVEFSIVVKNEEDRKKLVRLAHEIQAVDSQVAQQAIVGSAPHRSLVRATEGADV